MFVLSIGILVRLAVDPHAALRGYRGPGSVVAAFILIPLHRLLRAARVEGAQATAGLRHARRGAVLAARPVMRPPRTRSHTLSRPMSMPPPSASGPAGPRRLGPVTLHAGVGASGPVRRRAALLRVDQGERSRCPHYVRGPLGAGDLAGCRMVRRGRSPSRRSLLPRPFAGRRSNRRGRAGSLLVRTSRDGARRGALPDLRQRADAAWPHSIVVGAGEGSVYTAGANWAVDLCAEDGAAWPSGCSASRSSAGSRWGPSRASCCARGPASTPFSSSTAALPAAGASDRSRLPEPVDRSLLPPPERTPLFPAAARRPGAALALANVGYAALAGFVVLALKERGVDGGAAVFTAFAIAVFASRVALSHVPDRAGPRPTATAAALLEATGLTVIAAAHSLQLALLGALIVGIGFSMLFPSLALMVVGDVDDERRGSALGAFTASSTSVSGWAARSPARRPRSPATRPCSTSPPRRRWARPRSRPPTGASRSLWPRAGRGASSREAGRRRRSPPAARPNRRRGRRAGTPSGRTRAQPPCGSGLVQRSSQSRTYSPSRRPSARPGVQ